MGGFSCALQWQGNQEAFCGYACNYRMNVESRGPGIKEGGKERDRGVEREVERRCKQIGMWAGKS